MVSHLEVKTLFLGLIFIKIEISYLQTLKLKMEQLISQIKCRDTIEYCRKLLDKQEKLITNVSIGDQLNESTIWLEIPKFTTDYYEVGCADYMRLTDEEAEWLCFADDLTIKEKNGDQQWSKIKILSKFKKLGTYWNQDQHHLWRKNSELMIH